MIPPHAKMTRAQELIKLMGEIEMHVKLLRVKLGKGSIQHPAVHLQREQGHTKRLLEELQRSLVHLERKQQIGKLFLEMLMSVFWAQEERDRREVTNSYLSALLTLKFFSDDVYVETLEPALQHVEILEELLLQRNPADKVDDKMVSDIELAKRRVSVIGNTYEQFIEQWIVASPLINPVTFKYNHYYLPKIRNAIDMPFLRGKEYDDILRGRVSSDRVDPWQRAREAVERDLHLIQTSPGHTRVSEETDHLLGIVFLLAQLELKLRWTDDVTNRSQVNNWYRAALRPIEVMCNEVLGIFDDALRTAIVSGDDTRANRLRTARRFLIVSMATRYSFRRQETRVLLTFFDKQNLRGRFQFQDDVVGVNSIEEKLFSYVGNPSPDDKHNDRARTVWEVHLRQKEFLGGPVRVFGLIHTGRRQLEDEFRKGLYVDLAITDSLRGFSGSRQDRRVIVEGNLNKRTGILQITTLKISPHSQGYRALVAFPLRYEQLNNNNELELPPATPRWRMITERLKQADVREREEHEEGVFSVPETVTEQRELVTDLLRDQGVRKAMTSVLEKKPMDLNLLDRDLRGKVWSALFEGLSQQHQHPASIRELNAYIQRYLNLFTRHTYFNVRDDGTNYLSSNWPTDLTGRHFYDCGVYAVETAYDLFHATRSVPELMLEFKFLTFLNHICMIVYFDDHSFLVNNATITPPKKNEDLIWPDKKAKTVTLTKEQEKIAAAFLWGRQAFTTVYDVTYSMFLAVLPPLSLNMKRSDADFKADIWKLYKNSQGWGISNDADVARRYFEDIQRFNKLSVQLAYKIVKLRDLPVNQKETAKHWEEATIIALCLYRLSEKMTERCKFVFFNKAFTSANPLYKVGYAVQVDNISRTTDVKTLPMYKLHEMLEQRKKNGQPLTPDQDELIGMKREKAHVDVLTESFETYEKTHGPCP